MPGLLVGARSCFRRRPSQLRHRTHPDRLASVVCVSLLCCRAFARMSDRDPPSPNPWAAAALEHDAVGEDGPERCTPRSVGASVVRGSVGQDGPPRSLSAGPVARSIGAAGVVEDASAAVKRFRRTRAYREAFADMPASEPRTRAAQLADARAARVLKRPAAAPLAIVPAAPVVRTTGASVVGPVVPPVAPTIVQQWNAYGGRDTECLPVQPHLRGLAQHMSGLPAGTGDITLTANWLLGEAGEKCRIMSKRATGSAVGLDERKIGPCSTMLASTFAHVDREHRFCAESALASSLPPEALLAYVEVSTFDETPLKLSLSISDALDPSTSSAAPGGGGPMAVLQHGPLLPSAGSPRVTTPVKLLQSAAYFGMAVRTQSGEIVLLTGTTHNWLQAVSRTTGECMVVADAQRCAVSEFAHRFQFRCRIGCFDHAASNPRAEKEILARRNEAAPGWHSLVFFCEVHMVAGVHRQCFSICASDLSGQINVALTLNLGTNLQVFRRVLKEYIAEKLVVKHGEASRDAELYRRGILRLCLANTSRAIAKRMNLQLLPNGDWRKRGVIEVFVPQGIKHDRRRVVDVISSALVQSIASARMTLYPRSRWTKGEKAWGELILMEALHGLLSSVWKRFCQEVGQVGAAKQTLAGGPDARRLARGPPLLSDREAGDAADQDGLAEVGVEGGGAEDALAGGMDSAREENERRRRLATEWLETDPLSNAVILRMCLEPLRKLLGKRLELGSVDWESKQKAAVAHSLAGGVGNAGDAAGAGRKYAVVEAAGGAIEQKCHTALAQLLQQAELWQHVLRMDAFTLRKQGLAFRLVSSAGCLVASSLDAQHCRFPFLLFSLLAGRDPQTILNIPECVFDAWSLAFVQRHRNREGGGLGSAQARAELELHAALARVDISPIEALHASVRRRVVARGNQTHSATVDEASADFLLARVRKNGTAMELSTEEGGATTESVVEAAPARDGRRAGPWRAFVRQRSFGGRGLASMSELKQEYRSLSPAEFQEFKRLGNIARSSQPESGHGSFGPRTRDIQRHRSKRLKTCQAVSQELAVPVSEPVLDFDQRCELAVDQAVRQTRGTSASMEEMLAIAKSCMKRSVGGLVGQKAAERSLTEWIDENRLAVVDSLIEAVPRLGPLRDSLMAWPSVGYVLVECRLPVAPSVRLAQIIADASQRSGMAKSLREQWALLHKPIMHEDCLPIGGGAAAGASTKSASKCSQIGFCICTSFGKKLSKIRVRFYQVLKNVPLEQCAARAP